MFDSQPEIRVDIFDSIENVGESQNSRLLVDRNLLVWSALI
jgi:hypothetical protein